MATPRSGATNALVREGSIYTVATAVQLASSAAVIPIVTRLLPPQQYGVVTAAVVIMQLATTVVMLGATPVVLREHFQGPDGPLRARELAGAFAALAAVGTSLLLLSGPWWSEVFRNIPFGLELGVATATACPAAISSLTQTLLRAQRRPGALVASVAVRAGGGQLIGLSFAATWERRALGYLVGLAVGAAAAAVLGTWLSRPRRPRRGVARLLRRVTPMAVPALPHSIAMYLLNAADRVFLERLATLAEVGRYQVAYALGSLGLVALSALNNGWQPILLGALAEDAQEVFDDTVRLVARVCQTGVILLIATSPFALAIAAPADYEPDQLVPVVAILALMALPYAFHLADVTSLLSMGRMTPLAQATAVALATNIAANLLLIPLIGLLGAAVATTLSYGVLAVWVRASARRLGALRFSARVYVVPVVVTLVLSGLVASIPAGGLGGVLRAMIAIGATVALARVVRAAVTMEEATDDA